MSSAPTPIAEGTLSETPLEQVLLVIEQRQLGGTLALWPDDDSTGQDRLRFDGGVLVAARLREPHRELEGGLLALFARRRAPYAFYPQDLVGDGPAVQRGRLRATDILAAGVRQNPRREAIARALESHGDAPLRLRAAPGLRELPLAPHERAVVERLRAAPASRAELTAPPSHPGAVELALYLLTITGHLEAAPTTRSRARALSEPARPLPPSPPHDLPAALRARWEQLHELIVAADGYNAFELLGVSEAASSEEVTTAYANRARAVHPDRLEPALAPLAPFCQRLFHQLTEAKKTLLDPTERLAYLKSVRAGGGTAARDRELNAIVSAALEFRKTDVLLKQRRYEEALEVLEEVLAVDPNEPDYLARKALVLSLIDEALTDESARPLIALCDAALSSNERHEQAHLVRASIDKRLGRHDDALAHFARVLEINPGNLDAARELRLADMRRKGTAPAEPSLLGKLFGPKK